MNNAEAVWVIDDRVDGIYNDLKAFIYIRLNGLQHGSDNIGGGNITQATALFSALNFLSKIQYYLDKRTATPLDIEGQPNIIEEQAFIHLVRMLKAHSIDLGLPEDGKTLKLVWSGFRNKLAHVSNVEFGKQVLVYVINDIDKSLTVTMMLEKIKGKVAFEHDGHQRNWTVNADVLLAKLPMIKSIITDEIFNGDQIAIDYALLEEIIG